MTDICLPANFIIIMIIITSNSMDQITLCDIFSQLSTIKHISLHFHYHTVSGCFIFLFSMITIILSDPFH